MFTGMDAEGLFRKKSDAYFTNTAFLNNTLGLHEGQSATAIFKAGSVILAVE